MSCGKFLEDQKTGVSALADSYYVGGFLTAYNYMSSDTSDIANGRDMDGIMAWLGNYCRENPLKPFQTAVLALVAELYPQHKPVASKKPTR